MDIITKSEAEAALKEMEFDGERFSVIGEPDHLGPVTVYFVRAWDGENVDFRDVLFVRRDGKVKVYENNLWLVD